jgi:hypothetical protein
VSSGHELSPAARDGGAAPAGALGLLGEHRPQRVACGRSRVAVGVPGLLAGHGPRRVARDRCCAAAVALGLSAGHGPRRAARDRGPTTATGLQWTWVFGFKLQLVI